MCFILLLQYAFLLSSDLATLFTGRTFEIEVFPFSFREYIKYYGYKDIDAAFDKFIYEGGMSGAYLYKDEDKKYNYILDVYKTLIVRDINEKIYIQVSDNIDDSKTFEREVNSLLKIKDAYLKMLIARTKHDSYLYEGIKIHDIARWLNE